MLTRWPLCSRKKIAVRAVGKPGSPERIEWAIEVLDDLRRKIEGGRTTQLLACPRIIQHGTLGHASWLIHKVTENADLVNSASGSGSLATPTNEMEKAARNIMQDKAGFPKYTPNSQESSVQEVLKLLAKSTRSTKDYCLATCPHCQSMWFLSAAGNRALHECQSLRDWFLPLLFDDHKEQLELKAEADALVKLAEAENKGSEDPEDSDVLLQVTRVSHTGFLPWTAGDSIAEEDEWEETCVNKPPVGTESVKKTRVMTDPLAHRALDVRGRISSLCLRLEPIITTPQLLSLPVASSLFEDGQPIPMKDMQFITLENFVKDHSRDLIEAGADLECLTAIAQAKTIWLASITSLQGEDLTKFLVDEVIKFAAGRKAKTVEPKIPRSDIEAAYRERIATRTLRPYFFKWDTGVDERKKDADQSVASTSSSAISTAL